MIRQLLVPLRHLPPLVVSGLLWLGSPVFAQDQDASTSASNSPDALLMQGDQALQQGDYAAAEAAFDQLIEDHGSEAERNFGPVFGKVYYGRGLARLVQERPEEAIEDFQVCIEDFEGPENSVLNLARFQWGTALRLLGDYEEALAKFGEFGAAATSEEALAVGQAQWEYEHAFCYIELGQTEEARSHIETLTGNRREFGVQFRMLADILVRFTEKAIEDGDEEEAIKMVGASRGMGAQGAHDAFNFVPQFFSLAQQAKVADMPRLQLLLYSLVPQEQELRDSIELSTAGLPSGHPATVVPGQVEEALDAQDAKGEPHDLLVLLSEAAFYENSGNDSASLAIYRACSEAFDEDVVYRPDVLVGAARTALRLGLVEEMQRYGREFLEQFPGHENEDLVRQMLLENLFYQGKYQVALDLAREMRPQVEEGSDQAEMVDYVAAGSLYFLGQFGEAQTALASWLSTYDDEPDQQREEWMRYFNADNKGKLQKWSQSAGLLDSFLADYPESGWLDRALFSRAQAHYALQESELALTRIEELREKVPDTDLKDQVLVLEGQVQLAMGNPERAREAFDEGLALAEAKGNSITAGEALYSLVSLLVEDEGQDAETLAYYEKFLAEYRDNPYRAQVVSLAVPALERDGRVDEALTNMEETFLELGARGDAFGLSETISAWADTFMAQAGESPDEQLARAQELSGHLGGLAVPEDQTTLRARLAMAKISVFQKLVSQFDEGSDAEIRASTQVQRGYDNLRENFPIEDLDSFALMSLANQLYASEIYSQAADYYRGAVALNDQSTLPRALLGLGKSLIRSEAEVDQQRAIEQFEELRTNHPTENRLHGEAIYAEAELYERRGDWQNALGKWEEYLEGKYGEHAAEATYRYAVVADEHLDEPERALGMYGRVFTVYRALFPYAVPSLARAAEITADVQNDSQLAYDMLDLGMARYEDSMRRGTLVQAGYDSEEVDQILAAWEEIGDLHERLRGELQIPTEEN